MLLNYIAVFEAENLDKYTRELVAHKTYIVTGTIEATSKAKARTGAFVHANSLAALIEKRGFPVQKNVWVNPTNVKLVALTDGELLMKQTNALHVTMAGYNKFLESTQGWHDQRQSRRQEELY